MRYFIGSIVIVLGFLLVWKADYLVNNWGRVEWAETHLSTEGGTRVLYKIIGIVVIIGAFLAMTGLLQDIFRSTLGPLFGLREAPAEVEYVE